MALTKEAKKDLQTYIAIQLRINPKQYKRVCELCSSKADEDLMKEVSNWKAKYKEGLLNKAREMTELANGL